MAAPAGPDLLEAIGALAFDEAGGSAASGVRCEQFTKDLLGRRAAAPAAGPPFSLPSKAGGPRVPQTRGGEPQYLNEQLQILRELKLKGTVEEFHDFLIALKAGSLGKDEEARADAEFLSLVAAALSTQTRDHATLAAVRCLREVCGPAGDEVGASRGRRLLTAVADASVESLEECLRGVNYYKTKARNTKAMAAFLLAKHGGRVPRDFADLVSLPGVGPKVANLVRAVTFEGEVGECGMVVDTHVHRLSRILGWTNEEDRTPEHTRRKLEAMIPHEEREGLTRKLIALGQEVCLPRAPRCERCPLAAARVCPSSRLGRDLGPSHAVAEDAEASSELPPSPAPDLAVGAVAGGGRRFARPLGGSRSGPDLTPVAGRGAKRRIEIELE